MNAADILEKNIIPNSSLVAWREIDGHIVFLHKKERAFYELNETANFIWQQAVKVKNVKKTIEALEAEYPDIDKGLLREDAFDFISRLLTDNIFLAGK